MNMTIKGWRFEEAGFINTLVFLTNGMSVIEVTFDEQNNPELHYQDGVVFHDGLPPEVEKEFKRELKKAYPDEFHSLL